MRARQACIQRGKRPFRQHAGPLRPCGDLAERVRQRPAARRFRLIRRLDVRINEAVMVPCHDVAVLSSSLPDDFVMGADACETAAQQHVVRIVFPEGFADDAEIILRALRQIFAFQGDLFFRFFRKFFQIKDFLEVRQFLAPLFVEDGDVAFRFFLQKVHERDFGGMRGVFLHGVVEQPAFHGVRIPPPTEFVVEEITEQPRIFLLPACARFDDVVAVAWEIRMEDVRELGARIAVAAHDGEFVRHRRKLAAESDELRMRDAFMLDFRRNASRQQIEAPLLQQLGRLFRPFFATFEFLVVQFLMDVLIQRFAIMAVICAMIDAERDKATAQRVDGPPAAIRQFLHAEESRRFLLNIRNIAHAIIRRERHFHELFLFRRHVIDGVTPDGGGPFKKRTHAAAFQARPHNPRGLRRLQSEDSFIAWAAVQFHNRSRYNIVLQAQFQAVCLAVAPFFRFRHFKLFEIVRAWPFSVGHLTQFVERLKLPFQLVRNIHHGELPEMLFVLKQRHTGHAPTGRPALHRRDDDFDFAFL